MIRTLLCLCLFVLIAAPAAAANTTLMVPPGDGPVPSCPAGMPEAQPTVGGGVGAQASCSARCVWGSISCPSGTSSCSVQDVDCDSGTPGYVDCDGTRTYCGTATKWFQTSACCYGFHLWEERRCGASTSWTWQNTGYTDCLVTCDGSGGL